MCGHLYDFLSMKKLIALQLNCAPHARSVQQSFSLGAGLYCEIEPWGTFKPDLLLVPPMHFVGLCIFFHQTANKRSDGKRRCRQDHGH